MGKDSFSIRVRDTVFTDLCRLFVWSRFATACESIDAINLSRYDFCILIRGKDAAEEEAGRIEAYIHSHYRGKEVYTINGGQDVYDYILIAD